MSNDKKQEKMQEINNIDDILNSEDFKAIYDIDKEVEDLARDGWTLKEAMDLAKSLSK